MGSAVHGVRWALGYKRFLRLCQALGKPSVAEAYNSLCDEFGCTGNLYIVLSKDEFAWIDGPYLLAMYKARKWRQDGHD